MVDGIDIELKQINDRLLHYNLPEINMGQYLVIIGRCDNPSEDAMRRAENIKHIHAGLRGIGDEK